MLIAQWKGYRIMKQRALRWVAYTSSLSLYNLICHRGLNLAGKGRFTDTESNKTATIRRITGKVEPVQVISCKFPINNCSINSNTSLSKARENTEGTTSMSYISSYEPGCVPIVTQLENIDTRVLVHIALSSKDRCDRAWSAAVFP